MMDELRTKTSVAPAFGPDLTFVQRTLSPLVGKRIIAAFWGTTGSHPTKQTMVIQLDDKSAVVLQADSYWEKETDIHSSDREAIRQITWNYEPTPSTDWWEQFKGFSGVLALGNVDPRM